MYNFGTAVVLKTLYLFIIPTLIKLIFYSRAPRIGPIFCFLLYRYYKIKSCLNYRRQHCPPLESEHSSIIFPVFPVIAIGY